MESILPFLPGIQIALAVVLTVAILLQQRGAGLGGAFGGSEGSVHYERRGFERTLFRATIVISILFVIAVGLPIFIAPSAYTTSTSSETAPITLPTATGTIKATTSDGKVIDLPVQIQTTQATGTTAQ
jgi:preprotein translocase subunit SecG